MRLGSDLGEFRDPLRRHFQALFIFPPGDLNQPGFIGIWIEFFDLRLQGIQQLADFG